MPKPRKCQHAGRRKLPSGQPYCLECTRVRHGYRGVDRRNTHLWRRIAWWLEQWGIITPRDAVALCGWSMKVAVNQLGRSIHPGRCALTLRRVGTGVYTNRPESEP